LPSLWKMGSIPGIRPNRTEKLFLSARWVLFATLALAASVIGLAILALLYEHDQELARAQRDLDNLSRALAANMSRTLEAVDWSLAAGLRQVREVPGVTSVAGLHEGTLRAAADALPVVRAIALYGPDGTRRAASAHDETALPLSLAGSELFALHRAGKAQGLDVSAPVRAHSDRSWQLIVSRSSIDPEPGFVGVIAAALDPQRLAESYKAIELGENGSVALFTRQGVLLATHPWRDEMIGTTINAARSENSSPEMPAAANPQVSPFTRHLALSANTPLPGYPLTLSLMADRNTVLGPWRRKALVGGAAAVLIAALLLALGVLLDRQLREREASMAAQKQSDQAIQSLNEQLERRVAERTAELLALNRELESFAYSVSHDLRAPLRSIDGFSRILLDEYAGRLDPAATEHLSRVRKAAQSMAQLIDDLLSLSRVTRAEVKRTSTDMSGIARTIIDELHAETPNRDLDARIQPGIVCVADPNLLRIALYNLLANAWKFTSKCERASIELGTLLQRDETVYYVRDNGAGFDMNYAGKLFGAFQRMHPAREFEGTGIGLATVRRIVERHGGTVWAEAEVNQGATFYFTLSAAQESR
jgi:signal transduction histidine kinase